MSSHTIPINELLRRVDTTWTASADARERGRAYLLLASKVFSRAESTSPAAGGMGRSAAKFLPMLALAIVARERWQYSGVGLPPERVIDAIRRINWDTLTPTSGHRFLPVVKGAIEARWRP